jgi:ABC-2 type transport system ATP-binding protein
MANDSLVTPISNPVAPVFTPPLVAKVEHLSFNYGDQQALSDVSFSVPQGQVVALLGHNGAGKTTTIRILNGLLKPQSGHVSVFGLNPTLEGEELRRHTSVVTDALGLHDRETPIKSMKYHAQLWGLDVDETVERGRELLKRFGLEARAGDRIKSFSRGMKQRLAIARSLLNNPRLLLLDEPTLGMDPVARQDFREMIADLQRDGVSVVISTHDLGEVERVCDRLVILQHGRTLMEGTPQECMRPFMRNVEVEVECDGGLNALQREAVQRTEGTGGFRVEGNIALFRAADVDVISNVVSTLVVNGARVIGVGTRSPSLEDVYLRIHEVNPS